MNRKLVASIAVILIVIIVVAGAYQAGYLSGKSGTVKNGYAPNVVTASDLNKSLGGTWTRASSGYGSASNVSTVLGLVSTTTPTIAGSSSVHYTPALGVQTPNPSAYGNIGSFEFSIFSPNHAGFAGVAIANYRTEADANATYAYMAASVTPQSNSTSLVALGNASGYDYIYVWAKVDSMNLTPNSQNESLLVGHYLQHLILIFYLTPGNLSQDHFASLYLDQINNLKSTSGLPSNNVLVTASGLGNAIGGTWNSTFMVNLEVANASAILHEFSGTLTNTTGAQRALVDQILGNLSQVALQSYVSGKSNSTVFGFAKFLNDKVPYALYLDVLGLVSALGNSSTGNVSGAQYVYYSLYIGKSFFNPTPYSLSILVADYNTYAIMGMYTGTHNVTQSQFASLLQAQISLL